ncbi:alpha-ketoglutarate-dependent dioxygenase alkB homolog 4 [Trichonephila clavata]|uniref:Alpha-ketoglutarate-dependent dioxygenase alkB homolog 4 n=1 Tax=Trichonephila clavata TaxID=2740835 RepID=A0A8X6F7R7_TRICU|nr:alpha-ketoglutarate-dependent dioxygenase alkB homolog 4 [Trichonephila clavata]
MDPKEKCGCKGIRSCLICEKGENKNSTYKCTETDQYSYCPYCNLCWPEGASDSDVVTPLYVSRVKLLPDFISEEEESSLIDAIDLIPWMQSQSGRKKQDFGPKINFKKKKAKIDNFKGFPCFSKSILERFKQFEELSDFFPVELCHLEYSPDRGSAIDPHIDDFWIWGERLVTINLASSTTITLTPANMEDCSCLKECKKIFADSKESKENFFKKGNFICEHKMLIDSYTADQIAQNHCNNIENLEIPKEMCSMYRKNSDKTNVEVKVELPPRSLLILAGCSRYNWFHAIKREDILSRRLAMTFRELAENFMENEKAKILGTKLLQLGETFYDP